MHLRPVEFFGQWLEARNFKLSALKARESDITGSAHVSCICSAIFQKLALRVAARVRVRARSRAKVEKFEGPQMIQKC